jgi:hypothetical protein
MIPGAKGRVGHSLLPLQNALHRVDLVFIKSETEERWSQEIVLMRRTQLIKVFTPQMLQFCHKKSQVDRRANFDMIQLSCLTGWETKLILNLCLLWKMWQNFVKN